MSYCLTWRGPAPIIRCNVRQRVLVPPNFVVAQLRVGGENDRAPVTCSRICANATSAPAAHRRNRAFHWPADMCSSALRASHARFDLKHSTSYSSTPCDDRRQAASLHNRQPIVGDVRVRRRLQWKLGCTYSGRRTAADGGDHQDLWRTLPTGDAEQQAGYCRLHRAPRSRRR